MDEKINFYALNGGAPVCTIGDLRGGATFHVPNKITRWRCVTFFTKEPVTLEWIDTFKPGEILIDVGANVGMYSIWAAVRRGVNVFAFEPESQNYALLVRNILLNNLADRIKAYPLAIGDRDGLGTLHLSRFQEGDSCHSLDANFDFKGKPFKSVFAQPCVCMALDSFYTEHLKGDSSTNAIHVKVDVDGLEHDVIFGALGLLCATRSVLVELNPALAEHREVISVLDDLGFEHDPAQVERSRRKSGPFEGVAEYIFRRK